MFIFPMGKSHSKFLGENESSKAVLSVSSLAVIMGQRGFVTKPWILHHTIFSLFSTLTWHTHTPQGRTPSPQSKSIIEIFTFCGWDTTVSMELMFTLGTGRAIPYTFLPQDHVTPRYTLLLKHALLFHANQLC